MKFQFVQYAPHIPRRLRLIPRQGWVDRKIEDPETVWDHTVDLLELASEVLPLMPDFQGVRSDDVLAMLELHDYPESNPKVGDAIELHSDSIQKQERRRRAQRDAMEQICGAIAQPHGSRMLGIWTRFAYSKDEVAKFARALDKFQPIELAFRYEREGRGPKGLGAEFVRGSPPIEHPILKARFERTCKL